jgi:hypothetical protein
LDQKDNSALLSSDTNFTSLPRFDKVNKEFARGYRKSNALKAIFHFRAGFIGAIIGGAVLSYTLTQEKENQAPVAVRPKDL